MPKKNNHFNLVSLGCPKNRVDSERILGAMTRGGFAFTDEPSDADIIIINTCAFIVPAVEESIDTILDLREENPDAFLVVAGCLPMRYGDSLREPLPEVNLFLGPEQILRLPELLEAARRGDSHTQIGAPEDDRMLLPRVLTTPGYAYLKIAEGCSRKCRYCTIPSIRGPLRSFDEDELVEEAEILASSGVRELILVAQDLTAYGKDRKERNALLRLLERIRAIRSIRWIRLMYLYPDAIPPGLPSLITESDNILRYLDIPFQHISDAVLQAMGRPWKGDRIRRMVDRLREEIPGLVLRTTLMVGFPGEEEKEFRELEEFVKSYRIDHVGVFSYSPEEQTRAFKLGDPVPGDVKIRRADEIRRIHSSFSSRRNRKRIGSVEQALVERVSTESELLLQGRTWDQAPEVDGVLYITAGNAAAGEIQPVLITGAHDADLFGEIVEDEPSDTLELK